MNPRVSRRTAVLGGLLIVACSLCAAQSLTGQKILEQCARNYDEVKDYIVEIQRQGVSHHAIIVHGDVRKELELLASELGIRSFTV